MKKNIIELGNDLLLKSKELQQALNQIKLHDEKEKESEAKVNFLNKEVEKKDELICLKKLELNEKQTDINCLNGLVLKLNEDISYVKSQQICSSEGTKKLPHSHKETSTEDLQTEENLECKELAGKISCLEIEKEEILLAHKRVKEHLEEELKTEKMLVSELKVKIKSTNSLSNESKAKE